MLNRIVLLNDPVNWVDPYGLQCEAPTAPGIPWFPPILPPVFYPGTPENQMLVDDVNDIIDWLKKQMEGSGDKNDPLNDYPADPDDWNSPDGWEETNAGEKTGGKHRQWKGPDGKIRRRWDREGREGGKERGPHWHDPQYPGGHIEP